MRQWKTNKELAVNSEENLGMGKTRKAVVQWAMEGQKLVYVCYSSVFANVILHAN